MPSFSADDYDYTAPAAEPSTGNYGGWTPGQDMSGATTESTQAGQLAYGASEPVTVDSIMQSIRDNVGDHAVSWIAGTGGAGAPSMVKGDGNLTQEQRGAQTESTGPGGLLGSLGDKADAAAAWMEKHKKASDVILGMIGGAYGASEKRDAAERLAQSRLNEQNNAERLTQEQNARYSASITGQPARTVKPQQPLKRVNGSAVFSNGKLA